MLSLQSAFLELFHSGGSLANKSKPLYLGLRAKLIFELFFRTIYVIWRVYSYIVFCIL